MNCDLHIGFQTACELCSTDRLETLEWLARHGEVWECTTVHRAGFPSLWAAERAATRAGRHDIVSRLKRNRTGVLV